MVLKSLSFLSLAMLLCFVSLANNTPIPSAETVNADRPSLSFDFNQCVAYGGGSSADYSEFTAISSVNSECSELSVFGGHLGRINPNRNSHSCTPGRNGTAAMCISGDNNCTYFPGHEKSLRINVLVQPGPDGVGSLNNISFFSQAPEHFMFLDGNSGPNNYPTKFAVRVLDENGEVYRKDNITTARSWTYRSFDFSSVPELSVTATTIFRIEILPYCLTGVASNIQAWDIEDLVITGGCNSVNGGSISTSSDTNICSTNGQSNTVIADLQGSKGQSFSWFVANENEQIISIQNSGNFDFNNLSSGNLRIYHIASEGTLTGYFQGSFIFNLRGCYDLSNGLEVRNYRVSGGRLTGPSQSSTFTICPSGNNILTSSLSGHSGESLVYLLTDNTGLILARYQQGTIDFSSLALGTYSLQALSYSGSISGAGIGSNLNAIAGCYALSSAVSIVRKNVSLAGGVISSEGRTSISFCNNMSSVMVSLSGNSGTNTNYIITDLQGRILSIQTNNEVFVGGITETNFTIWNISYEDGIGGLEIDSYVSALTGCYELSNAIDLSRDQVRAGSISSNGSDVVSLCLKNNDNQAVTINVDNQLGDNVVYLVTDEGSNILEITNLNNQSTIDFDGVTPGICQIYALLYNGNISGLTVGNNISALNGDCFDFSDPIRVERSQVESGIISGPASYDVCLSDSSQTNIDFSATAAAGNFFSWLVTDTLGHILESSPNGQLDFSNAPSGVCLIYHIAFSEEPLLYNGDPNINSIVSSCFELSTPVTVNRIATQGGSFTLSNGTRSTTVLIGQGVNSSFTTILDANVGDSLIYIIYDTAGTILATQTSSTFDFNSSTPGVCSIVAVSYNDLSGAVIGNRIDMLSGCYSQSNRIVVTKELSTNMDSLNAGVIVTRGGLMMADICIGDSTLDSLRINFLQNPIGMQSSFIVTDDVGKILELQSGSTFFFGNAGSGICNIYHVVYSTATLTGLVVDSNLSDLDGDFDLSEPVTVTRNTVAGGTLITTDSMTMKEYIVGDGMRDLVEFLSDGSVGDSSTLIVTDSLGVILEIPDAMSLLVEDQDPGVCLVWQLSYATGLQGLTIGNAVTDFDGCFALSNPIRITKIEFVGTTMPDGGQLLTLDSLMTLDLCNNNTNGSFSENFLLSGTVGDTMTFVLTDSAGEVLDHGFTLPYDFAGLSGTIQLWNLSWNGSLIDLQDGFNIDTLMGDFDFSNAVTVTIDEVAGGSIMTTDSLTSVTITVGDGTIDSIDVIRTNALGDTLIWIVTDTLGKILELPLGPPFTFEGAGEGVCQIWSLSSQGNPTGLAVDANLNDLQGCFAFSNPIEIIRNVVAPVFDGGSIVTTENMTEADICLGTVNNRVDVVLTGAVGDTMIYVVTNAAGSILALTAGPSFQFNGLQPGTCNIWHLSYNGTISGLEVGELLASVTGSYDLSNSIDVFREEVDGGSLMTTNNMTAVSIIVGDGMIDSIDVVLTGTIGDSTAYVITDTLGLILELPAGPPFTFEGAGSGVCRIWNLSYATGLTGLAVDANVAQLAGCFDFSNSIEVTRTVPFVPADGGMIVTTSGLTTADLCLGTANNQVDVTLSNATGEFSSYAVTDTSSTILAQFDAPPFQFNSSQASICEIWHVSYNGVLTGYEIGEKLDTLSGDFDLSNAITVTKEAVEGGTLMTTDNMTAVSIVVGDGMIDSIDVVLAGAEGDSIVYVITDTLGLILELPSGPPFIFEDAGEGVCQIWSLSYATGLTGLGVDSLVSNLAGCFELSNNIEVTRTTVGSGVSGGTAMTAAGMTTTELCLNNMNFDIEVTVAGAVGDSMTYVVTDTSGIILAIDDSSPISFASTTSAGICEIWHLSYNGTLTGLAIDLDVDSLVGDFNLSNAITVLKKENDGGLAQFIDDTFQKDITVGDGMPDTLNVKIGGAAGDSMIWLVTTAAGVIEQMLTGTEIIFSDTLLAGSCNIYHLSFTPGLSGLMLGANVDLDLDGCFDLSNALSVTKVPVVNNTLIAGNLQTVDSLVMTDICIGDNGAEVDLLLSGANGPNMSFVVTDTTGLILSLSSTEPIQFQTAGADTCEIIHIVYDSTLTTLMAGNDLDTLSGNFLLSNKVTVSKEEITNNSITLSNGLTTAAVTTADMDVDTLTVVSTGITADTSVYIVTDTFGLITAIQDSTQFIFDNQPTGVCLIRELSFDFGFTGLAGGVNLSELEGCFTVSNAIEVVKTSMITVSGGIISTPLGVNVEVCISNTMVDSVVVNRNSVSADTAVWVITDTLGVILALPDASPFAFDTLSAGACRVLSLGYNFPLTGLAIDSNVMNLGGTFAFSNPINVDKNEAEAGTLLTASGMSIDTIILGSDPIDSLHVNLTGTVAGENESWVVTDTLGNILDLNATPPFSFEGTGPGQLEVWNLTYADGLSGLTMGNSIETDLSGCYDFSDSIRVVKLPGSTSLVSAGTIAFVGGTTSTDVCLGNGVIDSMEIVVTGEFGPVFSILTTNSTGTIFGIRDTLPGPLDTLNVSLEVGPNVPNLRLHVIAYDSSAVNFTVGTNISSLQGNFSNVSNPLELNNKTVNAASIISSVDTLFTVVGDGLIDTLTVMPFGSPAGDSLAWVIYNDQGLIISIEPTLSAPLAPKSFFFETQPDGTYLVRRIAYNIGLTGLDVGSNFNNLDGCFDLSDPVVVVATLASLSGGVLLTTDSVSIVDFCFNSAYTLDSIEVILTDTLGESFAWVVTDTAGIIVDLPADPPFYYDINDTLTNFIWNISYEGMLVGLAVDEDIDTLSGSFLLSNPITVNTSYVDGGTLSTPGGQTSFFFCVGDGQPNIVNFILADTLGGNYQYVVADTSGNILVVPPVGINFLDFEGFGDGICRVYNMSSSEEIIGLTSGMNIDSLAGCYDLSNFLSVFKMGVDGNNISSTPVSVDNMISFCTSDGTLDSLTLSTGSTMGSYQFVITDENNEIDSVLAGNVIDFEGSAFGTCKIFGISYIGNFVGMPGDTVGIQAMASECEDITALPITVMKEDCSIPIITEVGGNGHIEIQNIGTAAIDVADLYVCSSNPGPTNDYEQITNLTIVCGATLLQPGDYVVVDLGTGFSISADEGEFALYSSFNFGSLNDIMHYVEWGSTPHLRTSTAVLAGLWTNGQFATDFDSDTALKYDGTGFLDTDWSEGSSTPCMMNFGGGATSKRLTYETYPNPAYRSFQLYIPQLSTDEGTLIIYDSFGKIVDRRQVLEGIHYDIDLSAYGSGMFYTKVIAGREGVVKKMIILK